jgi:hypothetical protein
MPGGGGGIGTCAGGADVKGGDVGGVTGAAIGV